VRHVKWFRCEARPDTLSERLARSRSEGYAHGAQEAKLYRLATAGLHERRAALDWLNTAIEGGRADLEAQQTSEREVNAWDMSCRIMFWVMLGPVC
jgi:hypothetical protein